MESPREGPDPWKNKEREELLESKESAAMDVVHRVNALQFSSPLRPTSKRHGSGC